MLNFSRWTPTLGVCFKWDSQKVLKIAHIGIFRHIGGVRWDRKITDINILWVKVLHAKNCDFSTTRGWEINFFRQNIAMLDWLCTETYASIDCPACHFPHLLVLCWLFLPLLFLALAASTAGRPSFCYSSAGSQSQGPLHLQELKSCSLSESTVHINLHCHNPYNVPDHSADVAGAWGCTCDSLKLLYMKTGCIIKNRDKRCTYIFLFQSYKLG